MTLEWPWPILCQGQSCKHRLFYRKKWKQWIFSEYIAGIDLKGSRSRHLIECAKVCEYWRSRSFLYHIMSRFCMFCALLDQDIRSAFQDNWSSGIEQCDSGWFFGNYCSLWHGNWLIYLTKGVNESIGSLNLCRTSYRYPRPRYQVSVYRTIGPLVFELLPFENFEIWHRNFANAISQNV